MNKQDKSKKSNVSESEIAGNTYASVSNASTLYGMDKFNTPKGHGFAAERANHLQDKLSGKNATIVGDDNIKNGADRIVNGINIQTKYCRSGSDCIKECFENGKFKYLNADGSPMQIEVPSDKYNDAIKAMRSRIERGEVSGVVNPDDASEIVRKGSFTYEQAKNIAKFGTVESIYYDAKNSAIIAAYAAGISSAISFAVSSWNGDDFEASLKQAAASGFKVGGTAFFSGIIASQLARTGLNSALIGSSEALVALMGPKAASILANAFRSGTNIYGAAAMKSASKMLRGNAITAAATFVVLSSFDVVNIFQGKISGAQLFKNLTTTASSIGGGIAGWAGGATAGAAIGTAVPIIGNAVGAVVGGLLGSMLGGGAAGTASNKIFGSFIEDDADKMIEIIKNVFAELCEDFLINNDEAEKITDNLKSKLSGGKLKDMHASDDRHLFAMQLLKPIFEECVKNRKMIQLPTEQQLLKGIELLLDDIDNEIRIHHESDEYTDEQYKSSVNNENEIFTQGDLSNIYENIKFELQINNMIISNVQDLQKNFNITDVINLFRKKILHKWLYSNNCHDYLEKISNIDVDVGDESLIVLLRDIFDVDLSDDTIKKEFYSRWFLQHQQLYNNLKNLIIDDANSLDIVFLRTIAKDISKNYFDVFQLNYKHLFDSVANKSPLFVYVMLMEPTLRNTLLSDPDIVKNIITDFTSTYEKTIKKWLKKVCVKLALKEGVSSPIKQVLWSNNHSSRYISIRRRPS